MLLAVIDRKWREHLYEMDYLQEGISLRAYAQRDPVVEYQREGFDMFNADDGGHQGGGGRLPVQPRGPGRGAPTVTVDPTSGLSRCRRSPTTGARGAGRGPRQGPGRRPAPPQRCSTPRPTIDGEAGVGSPVQQEQSAPAPWASAAPRRCRPAPRTRRPAPPPGPAAPPPPAARARRGREQRPVPQRAVLLRLRQEVQALPRRPRRRVTLIHPRTPSPSSHLNAGRPAVPAPAALGYSTGPRGRARVAGWKPGAPAARVSRGPHRASIGLVVR